MGDGKPGAGGGRSPATVATRRWTGWLVRLVLVVVIAWVLGISLGRLISFTRSWASQDGGERAAAPVSAVGERGPSLPPGVATRAAEPQYEPPQSFETLKAEAAEVTDELLRRYPRDPEAFAKAAQLAGALGLKDQTVRYWQQSLQLAPQFMTARYALAWLAMREGQYEEMASLSREALELAPDSMVFRDMMGCALIELGRLDEAQTLLLDSVRADTATCDTLTMLGKASLVQNDYARALEYYRKAVELDPQWSKALYGLATAAARSGHHEEAKEMFDRFKKTQSVETVMSEANQLIAAQRDAATIYQKIAEFYQLRGDAQRANKMSYWAGKLYPANSEGRPATTTLHPMEGRISENGQTSH